MPALEALQSASRAVSFFNTIALLWLGLTVLLNADRRRRWGTWVAGGGLVLAGLFFAAHSVFVGREFGTFAPEMERWWRAAWLPFIGPPYLWYVVMAWYTGKLRQVRQRGWLSLLSLSGAAALALLLFADPLPAYRDLVEPSGGPGFAADGIPGLVLIYPAYSLLCIALAIAVLCRPATSDRFMGDLGRRRAIPWLLATSAVLLLVALSLGGIAVWFLLGVASQQIALLSRSTITVLMAIDLLIAGLIAAAVVLMGRAIVSYEIFTGRTLPRHGLFRYWRNSLILAAGYGVVIGGSLDLPVDPIYRLLLAMLLMTLFFALVSWRSYAERERSIERLRPFVTSPRLYERLLTPAEPLDVAAPFRALCDDVLGARLAYLVALGPMAALVGPPMAHPAEPGRPMPVVAGLAAQLHSPQAICIPLDPARYGGGGLGDSTLERARADRRAAPRRKTGRIALHSGRGRDRPRERRASDRYPGERRDGPTADGLAAPAARREPGHGSTGQAGAPRRDSAEAAHRDARAERRPAGRVCHVGRGGGAAGGRPP